MGTRRIADRLARTLHKATARRAEADRIRQQVDRYMAKLLRNPDVSPVPAAEVRRIRDYAATAFGDPDYHPWLCFYTAYRGSFHEGWVPPDYFRKVGADAVNGAYRRICGARTLYRRLPASDHVPDLLYCVKGAWSTPDGAPVAPAEVKALLFAATDRVVVKREASARGSGVSIETRESFAVEAIDPAGSFVVQRFVRQSPGLAAISPSAVATIRINTIRPDAAPARAVASFLRVGHGGQQAVTDTSLDVPVVSAEGRLAAFANASADWSRKRAHPETGFVFDGAVIAGFPEAVAVCEALHERLPQLGLIGWDVTIGDNGAVAVLEMNAGQPDVKFIEMALGPCLTAFRLGRAAA